jgi:hypothetical protein
MRQLEEIANIIEDRGYSLHNIITDTIKEFNIKTLCHRSGIVKQAGYGAFDILVLLLLTPLMSLKTVSQLVKEQHAGIVKMKKDTIYRFKNNEKNPWRSLLMNVAKTFRRKTSGNNEPLGAKTITAFIIDDTLLSHTGWKIENITRVFDHCLKKAFYGFKELVLGYFDGLSIIPLDFSLHSEKALKPAKKKKQHKKDVRAGSAGGKRRKELKRNKIHQAVNMVKRAVKHGFAAQYVLCDSWVTSHDFIKDIRAIKDGAMHIIAGIRADKRKYNHSGEMFSAKDLIKKCKASSREKRCRSMNTRYYELVVDYGDIGLVKLLISRFPGNKDWRVFICTDTSLPFIEIMRIYGVRRSIEIMFKEQKQYLNLGKCQSNDFDAQIADTTISSILYILLVYVKNAEAYDSVGELYDFLCGDIKKKTLAEDLWNLFEDVLETSFNNASYQGELELSSFINLQTYSAIKGLFSASFLSNELNALSISA